MSWLSWAVLSANTIELIEELRREGQTSRHSPVNPFLTGWLFARHIDSFRFNLHFLLDANARVLRSLNKVTCLGGTHFTLGTGRLVRTACHTASKAWFLTPRSARKMDCRPELRSNFRYSVKMSRSSVAWSVPKSHYFNRSFALPESTLLFRRVYIALVASATLPLLTLSLSLLALSSWPLSRPPLT